MLISKAIGKTNDIVYMFNLIFLLLLLSGDVELNPGPLTRQDPRDILRKKSFSLSQAISNNLVQVAGILHEKELIPAQAKANVFIKAFDDYEKASRLMTVLETQLGCSGDRRQYLINACNALNELKDAKLTEHANAMLIELGISSGSTQQVQIAPIPVPTTSGGIEETDDPNGGQGATAPQPIVVLDPPDVKSEECPPMAKIKPINREYTPELIADVNIILVTATDTEYRAVMGTGTRIEGDGEKYTQVDLDEDVTFNLVMYGSYKVAVIRTGQGPRRTEAMLEMIQKKIEAQYVIAVGICYGMKESKTKLADIIVAESIIDISNKRATGDTLPVKPEEHKCGTKLYATFKKNQGFEIETKDGYIIIHCGVLVSENTLVASQAYKDAILKQLPQALGGEMEGVGLMTAAKNGNYEGIVIKAIADWGNENKEPYRKWQEFAAVGAAKYILYHLEATEKLKKK